MAIKKEIKKSKVAEISVEKQRGRPFAKGVSGNPKGKPKGTRNKATRLAETLLDGQTEKLVGKCVQMALDGDSAAMKVCMDRLIPPRKGRPINLTIPQIKQLGDTSTAMKAVINAVGEGEVTPNEAQVVSSVIEVYRKVIETTELESRIIELEKVSNE